MWLDSVGREILGALDDGQAVELAWLIERVHRDDRVRVEECLTRLGETRQRQAGAWRFRLGGGDVGVRWVELQQLPGGVRMGRGGAETSGTLREITAEMNAEALLIAQQEIVLGIAREVAVEETFKALSEVVGEQIGGPLSVLILLADPARRHLRVGLAADLPGLVLEPIRITPGGGVFSAATAFNEPAFTADLLRDEGWTELGQLAAAQGWQAAWAVPIRGDDQRVLGTLGILLKSPRLPDERERQVAARVAQLAGLAIERQAARAFRDRSIHEGKWRQRCYEALAAHRQEKTYCFDLGHRLAYADPLQFGTWGRPLEKLVGKSCGELGFDSWLADLYERNLEAVIQTGKPVEGEIPYLDNGEWRLLEFVLVPVLGEDGKVEGVSGANRQVKGKPGNEADTGFIEELTARLAPLVSEAEILTVAAEMVGTRLRAHRCGFIEPSADGDSLAAHGTWTRGGASDLAGSQRVLEVGRGLWGCLAMGSLLIEDVHSDPRTCDMAADYAEFQLLACAARPFIAQGRAAVVLAVGCDQPRQWTRDELWILDEAAARSWPLVERLRSEAVLRRHSEQLRASEERQAFLLELVDAIRPLNDPGEIQAAAARMLGNHLGVNRVTCTNLALDGEAQGVHDFASDLAPLPEGSGYEALVRAHCRSGARVVVADVVGDERATSEDKMLLSALGIRAQVIVPLVEAGQLVTALGVHHATPRSWTCHEIALIEACADRMWGALRRARAEKSLSQSEERFRSFAEHSDDILWIVDLEARRMEYLSPAFERIYGLDRAAIMEDLGKWIEVIHPSDHQAAEGIMPAIESGQRFKWEFRLLKPDGRIYWMENIAFPMPGEDGVVRRLGGKTQDITERKRAEEAARRVAEADAFRLTLANALAALVDPDEIHCAATDLLGGHLQATRVRWQEVSADSTEPFGDRSGAAVRRAAANRRTQRLVDDDVQAGGLPEASKAGYRAAGVAAVVEILLHKGGRPVARLSVEDCEPRRWAEDEVVLSEETAERIWAAIEQVRAENKLRESERRLRLVADHIPALISYVGQDLRYQFTNREYAVWLGNPGEDFAGKRVREVIGEKTFKHRLPLLRKALAGEVVRVEAVLDHQVLGERHLDLSLVPDASGGKVRGCYVMAVDVTERLQLVATLREADQRKNEFLATLAHELRNPLAPIRTGVEVLKSSLDRPERASQVIAVIERQTTQMVRLIDDLLDIARITRGTLKLHPAVIDLTSVIADAVEVVRPIVDRGRHTLAVSMPVTPIYARADAGRLAQVISNLLNNAARYTPEGGHIWLSAEAVDETISIYVRDDGEGIEPAMQTEIFEMFTQIGRHGRVNNEGLGIGLTLVRLLVGLHGGVVRVFSEGSGKGSEFRIDLPRCPAPEEPGGAAPAPASEPVATPRPAHKILVVDDARSTADMMALFLKLEGYETRTAYSGAAAIEVAVEMCPEIIFMDIGMPIMDGYETARRLRATATCRDTILIALTGWGQDSDRAKTHAAGFNHHLVKPVEPQTLRELLDKLIPG